MKSWTFKWLGIAFWAWMSSLAKYVFRDQIWVFGLQKHVVVSTSLTLLFPGEFGMIMLYQCDILPPKRYLWRGSSTKSNVVVGVFFIFLFDYLWTLCCTCSLCMDHTAKYHRIHLISGSNANFETPSNLFRLKKLINSFSFSNSKYIWVYYIRPHLWWHQDGWNYLIYCLGIVNIHVWIPPFILKCSEIVALVRLITVLWF